MSSARRTLWQIFQMPFWLGLLSIVGLVSALVGDDRYDVLSWVALGIPCMLMIWYGWCKPRT